MTPASSSAGVRPPMTMEEHLERLEALYTEVVDGKPAVRCGAAPLVDRWRDFRGRSFHDGVEGRFASQ